jgi:hypothetical protein
MHQFGGLGGGGRGGGGEGGGRGGLRLLRDVTMLDVVMADRCRQWR